MPLFEQQLDGFASRILRGCGDATTRRKYLPSLSSASRKPLPVPLVLLADKPTDKLLWL